jgi:predicted DNA-binding WGR domain protein
MAPVTTYLELSDPNGGAHKFYEVVVDDVTVTVRFGRIGESGQAKTSTYPTGAAATAEATKKINEKVRKGYAPAVLGARQRRPVSRRPVASAPSTSKRAPVLWRYRSGAMAFGIFVDDEAALVGNEKGQVTVLDHNAEVVRQFQLPEGVKCLVADADWRYAGCDDGNVYDLSGKMPRLAYRIAPDIDIYWLDICDGVLGVADADGNLVVIDHEDEELWRKRSRGSSGWMVRGDEVAFYHGHSSGVTSYDWRTGLELWHTPTSAVLFGWQEPGVVYAGTSARTVVRIDKDGKEPLTYRCDAAVYSCAASAGGDYVFAGDSSSSVYCFDRDGTRRWKLATGCGSALSMQYHRERLYLVTTYGSLACLDASPAAIGAAEQGNVPQVRDVKAAAGLTATTTSTEVEVTRSAAGGVVLECVDQGGRLRVRVVSPGYHDWNVQFPKEIRQAGARYVVPELRPSNRGDFYRTVGEIRKLVD